MLSLIFFAGMVAGGCSQKVDAINIVWNKTQAAGLSIPRSLLKNEQEDVVSHLQVKLQNNSTAMLGEYSVTDDKVLFKPLIPLSHGTTYQVSFNGNTVGVIKVPLPESAQPTSLLKVYPTKDTVPENLLKLYIEFSAPMQEGEALCHITLLNKNGDTVPNVFLDLQPELWNKERTVLTVWLDPGRIKRDLIPNRSMGNPLIKGHQYTLSISASWKDAQGLPLHQPYTKKLVVGDRDSISPRPERWKLKVPGAATKQPLVVSTEEALDYFLLQETLSIIDSRGSTVDGNITINNNETTLQFAPADPWQPGHYTLSIASHLEDLAGNNLNRPFDRDLRSRAPAVTKETYLREFLIVGK